MRQQTGKSKAKVQEWSSHPFPLSLVAKSDTNTVLFPTDGRERRGFGARPDKKVKSSLASCKWWCKC